MPQKLTSNIISAAIAGFEQQKIAIDAQISELRAMLPGGNTHSAAVSKATRKRRRFSAAARRKMAMAQRARWAKLKAGAEPAQSTGATHKTPKRKRRISEEGLARIVAATKARWARVRAAKPEQVRTAAKKKTAAKRTAGKKTATKRPPEPAKISEPATTQVAG